MRHTQSATNDADVADGVQRPRHRRALRISGSVTGEARLITRGRKRLRRINAAVIVTKDEDFVRPLDRHGPPPQIANQIGAGEASNL